MTSGSDNIRVLITSLFLTISIFALGLVAAHGLDFIRLNVLDDNFNNHVMNSDFLILEKEFLNTFDTDFCFDINNKLINLSRYFILFVNYFLNFFQVLKSDFFGNCWCKILFQIFITMTLQYFTNTLATWMYAIYNVF